MGVSLVACPPPLPSLPLSLCLSSIALTGGNRETMRIMGFSGKKEKKEREKGRKNPKPSSGKRAIEV